MDIIANAGPIVGREAELGALEAALSGLAEARSACLSLEGEPGIGKTRLLRELRERAERDGHLVLAGAGAEFESELPYGVWVNALDDYVASQDLDLSDDVVHELARVLPSLRADDRGRAAVAEERYRVHRAMRSLLSVLSDDQALLLVLDDLHWADDASIELLGALLRRGLGESVLIAIGFRSGQAPERLTAALAAQPAARHVLGPLDEAQAAELLAGVEPDAAAAIISRGGGVPFYLEQLARAGAEGSAPGTNGDVVSSAGCPPRSSRRCRRSSMPLRQALAPCSTQPPSSASRSSSTSLPRSPARSPAQRSTHSTTCWRPTSCADDRAAAVRLPPPDRAPGGLRVAARRPAPGGPRPGGRRARRARRVRVRARRPRPARRGAG